MFDQSDILAQPRADSHVLAVELVCTAKMLGVFGRGAANSFMQGFRKGYLQILVFECAHGIGVGINLRSHTPECNMKW